VSNEKKRWSELPPGTRAVIITSVVLDVGLRTWALADLINRPQNRLKGLKAAWAVGLALVSSAGVLPAGYLAWARGRG